MDFLQLPNSRLYLLSNLLTRIDFGNAAAAAGLNNQNTPGWIRQTDTLNPLKGMRIPARHLKGACDRRSKFNDIEEMFFSCRVCSLENPLLRIECSRILARATYFELFS